MATRGQHVLVIDDEKHIIDVLEYIFTEEAFKVTSALDGDAGWAAFRSGHPDIVILDLKLPGISGLELFRMMRRERPDVPVVMLTSKTEEFDRVLGLELGADDYVTKPFSSRELVARVRNILRRGRGGHPDPPDVLVVGPLELDPKAFSVRFFGQIVELTRAEFSMMELLMRNPNKVFMRDELIDRIYGNDHFVTDRSIDASVRRTRKKFMRVAARPSPIETVHSVGYTLNRKLGQSA